MKGEGSEREERQRERNKERYRGSERERMKERKDFWRREKARKGMQVSECERVCMSVSDICACGVCGSGHGEMGIFSSL